MIDISVRADVSEMQRQLGNVDRKTVKRILNRSINVTGRYVFTRLLRSVAKFAGAKQKDLRRRFFRVIRSNFDTLTYTIAIRSGAMLLSDFNPRQTKAGVTAKAWGESKVYDGAFIVESRGRKVYTRKTAKRFPIKLLYGPQPSKIAFEDHIDAETKANVMIKFRAEFYRSLKFYLKK